MPGVTGHRTIELDGKARPYFGQSLTTMRLLAMHQWASLASAEKVWPGAAGTSSSARAVVGAVIGLLWALAFWQSWECRGLYADGSVFFLDMILNGVVIPDFGDPRGYAAMLPQYPPLLAMQFGVSDLHWLARLYSLSLFGLPMALYSVALVRATRDPVILAATLAVIATVYMTTSIHIIGEYHIAYACAVFAAVWLITASGLRAWDGLILAIVAAVTTRCYEHYVYLGPLLALLTIWVLARAKAKPWLPAVLYGVAMALFLFGGYVAADSLIGIYASSEQRTYLESVLNGARGSYLNLQLDLLLVAAASIVVWGMLRPDDLRRPWPYLAAGLFLLLAAASPALVLVKGVIQPPYFTAQYASRTVAGLLTAAFVAFVWLHASGHATRLRALLVVKEPRVAQRLVILAGAMIVATMPWNIMLTGLYARYLEVVRVTIRTQSGPISIDAAIFDRHPHLTNSDIAPSTLSVIMRTSPTDGVLVNDVRNPADLPDPAAPPDLGRFFWRD